MKTRTFRIIATALVGVSVFYNDIALGCTGITLKAQDGAVVCGRTMEWGSFDLLSRVVIIPRGHQFTGQTPDQKPGKAWTGIHGVVGLDAVENLVMYYHTQNNRRVQKLDLKRINFAEGGPVVKLPLDKQKAQDIEDITPAK